MVAKPAKRRPPSSPPAPMPPTAEATVVEYADARAAHEYWKAQLAEQEFKKRSGELLDRAQTEQGQATLLATIAQTIRSWPDHVERVAGLSADQAETLESMVDSLCLTIQEKISAFRSRGGNG